MILTRAKATRSRRSVAPALPREASELKLISGYSATGVNCAGADGDGRGDLAGLNVTSNSDATVDWSYTIIERRSGQDPADEPKRGLSSPPARSGPRATVGPWASLRGIINIIRDRLDPCGLMVIVIADRRAVGGRASEH